MFFLYFFIWIWNWITHIYKEKYFHFFSFRECINKISKNNINFIFPMSNVDRLHFSQLFILIKKLLNFCLSLVKLWLKKFKLFKQIKLNSLWFIKIFFKTHNFRIQIFIVVLDVNLLFVNFFMLLIQIIISLFINFYVFLRYR